MKQIMKLWMPALTAVLLGLASCAEKDNPVSENGDGVQTMDTPDMTQPTTDQMTTRVTVPLTAAVMGNFAEGSTGAALVKRLPQATSTITADTRLVVLPGSDFNMEGGPAGSYDFMNAARVLLNGGYIALVQPTVGQTGIFGIVLLASMVTLEMEAYQQTFDMPEAAAARAAESSEAVQRMKVRSQNLQALATRAGKEELDDPFAEIVIFGLTDHFMQEPLPDEVTAYIHTADAGGNETAPETVTTRTERTPFVCGQMADAAAEWLNNVEDTQKASARRTMTRAGGSTAINEIMDACETFTHSNAIDWKGWDSETWHYTNRVKTTIRSWGVHNMESNKDYYYVKQSVTLRMGNENGWKIYYPGNENDWYTATNHGSYNRWYGSWLSQYVTTMNLTGSGSIALEAATPSTDNNSQTTSISIGSSTSTTKTTGISWGFSGGANASGPMGSINIGGSYSVGTTTGTSFTMGMTQTHRDFGVTKNTSGNTVTWTYKGAMPQYYENHGKTIYYCHQNPADILVNDCDVSEDICWSVGNPSGQYTLDATSAPQTAAMLYTYIKSDGYKNAPHKYEYTTTETANYTHTLLEPNRAMQTWRMNLTIDEWEGSPIGGVLGDLEDVIRKGFPDIYANVFTIADKTATSLNTITYIVNYSKQIFGQREDILKSYAKSYGVKKFTIHWSCDDLNVKTREGFTVTAE